MTENKKVSDLIQNYVKGDSELLGLIVYDRKNGNLLASTFDSKETQKQIKVSLFCEKNDERISKFDPSGNFRWEMFSFSRKIVCSVRINKNTFVDAFYAPEKAPSGAIEDSLEIALDVGELL
ncbi:hypothetical protein J4474_03605 [Candidatus Pacearchaeota archaeon]|nr:hypothetical protein [Candidatus Pacearchaeota archaeon]